MEKNNLLIKPVAYIESDFTEKFGVPRQSGRVPSICSRVIFTDEYSNIDAIRDIEGFSHLWLIFGFSLCKRKGWSPTVRPPRLGGNSKTGVFASRAPYRPNKLGLSSVKLLGVEKTTDGKIALKVSGADLVNGTPVYDIKPYLPFTDCHKDAVGGYADGHLEDYLDVVFADDLLNIIPEEKRQALIGCLREDPRPSYQNDGREYGMAFSSFNIRFAVKNKVLTVIHVEKI